VIADARDLHADPAAAGATFQVASQFNMLEMTSPKIIPEAGVARYELDPTQGPPARSRAVPARSTATTSCRSAAAATSCAARQLIVS
jgi:hypothetical protein